ncbi:MAG: hypothetical protein WKF48_01995 [Solirubrobacteraceae bacterium]
MRQYTTAVGALLERCPAATIVLRPYPSEGSESVAALAAHFPGATFETDRGSSIVELHARCDLCIGAIMTATLQAALAGTPVFALNLMGFEWAWPLGGDTTVPVARSRAELETWLAHWASGSAMPGREDLLTALGAGDGHDPLARMLVNLDAPSGATAPRPGSSG